MQKNFIILIFSLCWPLLVAAQEGYEDYDERTSLTEVYQGEAIERQVIKEATWKKAIRGLDYEPKPVQKRKSRERIGGNGRKLMTIIAVIAGAGLLAFLIAYFLGYIEFGKKAKEKGMNISIEEVEDRLMEADLMALINSALQQGNYKGAIRLYYLQTLKTLSEQQFIRWKKQKTNRNYLSELRGQSPYQNFKAITLIFDRVWYGGDELTEAEYLAIVPRFESFLQEIKSLVSAKTSSR